MGMRMLSNVNVEIKKASEEDAQMLTELGARTFYEAYHDLKFDVDLKEYISTAFIEEEIHSSIKNEKVVYIIAYFANKPVGYTKLRSDREHPNLGPGKNLEIERIYVSREYWRHKIGKALMDEIIKIANEDNYKAIWLGVWQENKRAISFYEKMGFEIFGVKKFYVGSEENDDYVMRLKIIS